MQQSTGMGWFDGAPFSKTHCRPSSLEDVLEESSHTKPLADHQAAPLSRDPHDDAHSMHIFLQDLMTVCHLLTTKPLLSHAMPFYPISCKFIVVCVFDS
jgi:hypothetical protein